MPMSLRTAALKVREAVGELWEPVAVKATSDSEVAPTVDMLSESIGIIAEGNQSAVSASTGQYVILRDSTIAGRNDGLYVAAQAIPANTAIDATYLTAVNNGGLNDLRLVLLNAVYPVGAIYISTSSTNPGTLFGGTWEQIQDRFLLAAGSSYSAGSTGGAATHTLATGNLPSHNHSVGAHSHGLNGHVHSVGAHSHGLNGHTHSIPALSGSTGGNGGHGHQVACYPKGSGSATTWGYTYANSTNSGLTGQATLASSGINPVGNHTHTVSTNASTTGGNSGSTANSSAFNTGGNSGSTANSSAFNSGNTGSGTAVNHMPPYLAVYVWKRTA